MNTTGKWLFLPFFTGCIIIALSPGLSHLFTAPGIIELREQFVYLTGVVAFSYMVLAMVLSARFNSVNRLLNGQAKAHRLHKNAGTACLIFILLHWLAENVPHMLVELNIIRNPGQLGNEAVFAKWQITAFEIGVGIAEVVFPVFIVLAVISLWKRIPYRVFRRTHKFFSVVFLLLAYHAGTMAMKEFWYAYIGGWLLLSMIAIGLYATATILFRRRSE